MRKRKQEWRERGRGARREWGKGKRGEGEGRQKGRGCMGMRREGRACEVGENAQ